jgi:alpha/beta superfamily hydrolase
MARREERPIAIAGLADPLGALEGIYVGGEPGEPGGAVIAPPHPLYGGSLESPVVGEIAHACARAGLATIRFNWRGVGASAGERSGDPGDAADDYAAALAYLADSVPGRLLAAGYSFGAATALAAGARHPRVDRLLLVCPPASMLDRPGLEGFAGRTLVVAGGEDRLAPPADLDALCDGERIRLEVIEAADHFFLAGLGELGRIASRWVADSG